MQAIILAAGIGKRISSSHNIPKILLEFDEKTLLERHISNLHQLVLKESLFAPVTSKSCSTTN